MSVARAVGRSVGRWWYRVRPGVVEATRPARAGWAAVAAQGWLLGYAWIGVVLAVAAERLSPGGALLSWVVAVGGGVALGTWQARWRVRRHRVPGTPPPARFGLATTAWLALVVAAVLLQRAGAAAG